MEDANNNDTSAKGKNEALLTAGMGYGNKKKADLEAFWNIVLPGLLDIGWEVIKGEGDKEGTMMFVPPGVDKKTGKRNIDYYDRIKILLERIEERRNSDEAKLADLFREKTRNDQRVGSSSNPLVRPRRGPSRSPKLTTSLPPRNVRAVDISWKHSGTNYPKRTSQVGDEYQVSSLPPAGSYSSSMGSPEPSYEIIWDNNEAITKGVVDFIDKNVVSCKKENAMFAFHKNNYSLENASEILETIRPSDCTDWTDEEKETFRRDIFRKRKDFKALSLLLNKNMGDILAYYLGTYKKSDDYRLLKTVLVEERIEKARSSLHHIDQCAICEDGGSLLICDGCESEWHMTCTRPVLKTVPEGRWECDLCVDRKFLDGWQRTVQSFGLPPTDRKRKLVDLEGGSITTCDEESKSQIVDGIKRFSRKLDSIFMTASTSGTDSTKTSSPVEGSA
ncbi:PHD-finger domain containing protein [Nitzschia inconspicua]|uniref:PHD-finger domain containing protein n=1 Tax=Nitzschia inconspicua TaxID=303405 RepID=A0A9K3LC99_9STRA|nr:PHD-finger domain containing protein [Nitzschia inconspicua]